MALRTDLLWSGLLHIAPNICFKHFQIVLSAILAFAAAKAKSKPQELVYSYGQEGAPVPYSVQPAVYPGAPNAGPYPVQYADGNVNQGVVYQQPRFGYQQTVGAPGNVQQLAYTANNQAAYSAANNNQAGYVFANNQGAGQQAGNGQVQQVLVYAAPQGNPQGPVQYVPQQVPQNVQAPQYQVVYGGQQQQAAYGGGQQQVVYGAQQPQIAYGGQQQQIVYGGQQQQAGYAGQQVAYGGQQVNFAQNAGSQLVQSVAPAQVIYSNQVGVQNAASAASAYATAPATFSNQVSTQQVANTVEIQPSKVTTIPAQGYTVYQPTISAAVSRPEVTVQKFQSAPALNTRFAQTYQQATPAVVNTNQYTYSAPVTKTTQYVNQQVSKPAQFTQTYQKVTPAVVNTNQYQYSAAPVTKTTQYVNQNVQSNPTPFKSHKWSFSTVAPATKQVSYTTPAPFKVQSNPNLVSRIAPSVPSFVANNQAVNVGSAGIRQYSVSTPAPLFTTTTPAPYKAKVAAPLTVISPTFPTYTANSQVSTINTNKFAYTAPVVKTVQTYTQQQAKPAGIKWSYEAPQVASRIAAPVTATVATPAAVPVVTYQAEQQVSGNQVAANTQVENANLSNQVAYTQVASPLSSQVTYSQEAGTAQGNPAVAFYYADGPAPVTYAQGTGEVAYSAYPRTGYSTLYTAGEGVKPLHGSTGCNCGKHVKK